MSRSVYIKRARMMHRKMMDGRPLFDLHIHKQLGRLYLEHLGPFVRRMVVGDGSGAMLGLVQLHPPAEPDIKVVYLAPSFCRELNCWQQVDKGWATCASHRYLESDSGE